MRTTVLIVATATLLIGCQSTLFSPAIYSVKKSEDKFSKTAALTYSSENNLVAEKPILGKTYTGDHGLYINPRIQRNDKGEINLITLNIINISDNPRRPDYAVVKPLGMLREIIFRIDDSNVIQLKLISGFNDTERKRTGMTSLTQAQFKSIAFAQAIALKVRGTSGSTTYEDTEIMGSFKENLKNFYTQYIVNNAAEG